MARATFITRVVNLAFSCPLGQGERFFDDLRITNDRSIASDAIDRSVQEAIGSLEADWLREADALVYGRFPWERGDDPAKSAISTINLQLIRIRMLLQALWLVRDHAADTEQGFLICVEREGPKVSSNSFSTRYTMADGTRNQVAAFSREQLGEARALVAQGFRPTEFDDVEFHRAVNDATRFSRAMYFVEAARSSRDLFLKVANYCTALECLLAAETGELTHRLGERLARFIGVNVDERRSIYGTVKRAYEVRSRTVHGSRPGAEHGKVVLLAVEVDELLRRALKKVVLDEAFRPLFCGDTGDQEQFRRFLLDLVLS